MSKSEWLIAAHFYQSLPGLLFFLLNLGIGNKLNFNWCVTLTNYFWRSFYFFIYIYSQSPWTQAPISKIGRKMALMTFYWRGCDTEKKNLIVIVCSIGTSRQFCWISYYWTTFYKTILLWLSKKKNKVIICWKTTYWLLHCVISFCCWFAR